MCLQVCVCWLQVSLGFHSFDRRNTLIFSPMARCQVNTPLYQSIAYFTMRHQEFLLNTAMHCFCGALWIIHQPSVASETESKTNKMNTLPVMRQFAMNQISPCAQSVLSRERIISERPQGGGSVEGACDCWVMIFPIWHCSQWPRELTGSSPKSSSVTTCVCLEH